MIQQAIVKIVNKEDLTYNEAYAVMNEIMGGQTTPTQNAAFLAALSTKSARARPSTRSPAAPPPCGPTPPGWTRGWTSSRSWGREGTTPTASTSPPPLPW